MKQPVFEPQQDMFRQTKPCSDCPFLKDGGVRHPLDQMCAYASYFLFYPGATFPCHQSVPKDDDRQGWSAWKSGQTLCAGGIIFAEKHGLRNAIVIYGAAQGWLKTDELMRSAATVFDSIEDMIRTTIEARGDE
jgi:hypothetical protein